MSTTFAVVLLMLGQAQVPLGPPRPKPAPVKGVDVKRLPTPADAVALVAADLAKCAREGIEPEFQRYVWIPNGEAGLIQENRVVMNAIVSELLNPVLCQPVEVAGGRLLRWDLSQLAPREINGKPDVLRLIAIWEKLTDEPYFHATRTIEKEVKIKVKPYRARDGKTYNFKIENRSVRVPALAVIPGLAEVAEIMNTNAPICRVDRLHHTLQTAVDGGLYYWFIGAIDPSGRRLTQAEFLARLKISESDIAGLRSDQKTVMFRSLITGKPRAVLVLTGSHTQAGTNQGLVTITLDMADGDVDARQHPMRNLIKSVFAAVEIIIERNNGLHVFLLYNGKGLLQDSAPDDVAKDHKIPPPFTARLQPCISCVRCHGTNPDAEGYQPLRNDLTRMLKGLGPLGLNVFGERNDGQPIPDTLNRLVGLYNGDLIKPLMRGRNDYAEAVTKVTEIKARKLKGLSVVEVSTSRAETYKTYLYDEVTPLKACLELGFDVEPGEAVKLLRVLIPRLPPDELGIRPEDTILGALKAGLAVNRLEWEQVYADAGFRSTLTVNSWLEQRNAKPK